MTGRLMGDNKIREKLNGVERQDAGHHVRANRDRLFECKSRGDI
jgi:hypothetical protein